MDFGQMILGNFIMVLSEIFGITNKIKIQLEVMGDMERLFVFSMISVMFLCVVILMFSIRALRNLSATVEVEECVEIGQVEEKALAA